MADIYLLIEGQQKGPYSEDQVRKSLAMGSIPPGMPAWHEGLADWVQVESLGLLSQEPQSLQKLHEVTAFSAKRLSSEMFNALSDPKQRDKTLKYLGIGLAVFVGLLTFGLSIGAGMALVQSRHSFPAQSQNAIADSTGVPTEAEKTPIAPAVVRMQEASPPVSDERAKYNEASKSAIAINLIKTDQTSYQGQDVQIAGHIALDSFYVGGYRDAEDSHYCFSVQDGTGTGYVFGLKDGIGVELRSELLQKSKNGEMDGVLTIRLTDRSEDSHGALLCELISYSALVPKQ